MMLMVIVGETCPAVAMVRSGAPLWQQNAPVTIDFTTSSTGSDSFAGTPQHHFFLIIIDVTFNLVIFFFNTQECTLRTCPTPNGARTQPSPSSTPTTTHPVPPPLFPTKRPNFTNRTTTTTTPTADAAAVPQTCGAGTAGSGCRGART
jgi:hypothetical protein